MKLEVRNLKKTYGTVQALKGINYTFTPGVYGILGANGAGKSTMINLITDNVSRDKMNGGSILFGEDSAEEDILKLGKQFRGLVGYMPQQQGFYEDFSPKAFLKYMAEIKGVKKIKTTDDNGNEVVKTVNQQIDELLEVVNLTKVAYKKIGGFSGGMKQTLENTDNLYILQCEVTDILVENGEVTGVKTSFGSILKCAQTSPTVQTEPAASPKPPATVRIRDT